MVESEEVGEACDPSLEYEPGVLQKLGVANMPRQRSLF